MAAVVHARLGRWDLTAETVAKLLERDGGDHAHWCLAAALLARAALEKASGLHRLNVPQSTALGPSVPWADLLICDILHREAEVLIAFDAAFPADPFAP